MHPIIYKFGIVIGNSRRFSWSVYGHEGQDDFIYILTGGITQDTGYHCYNVLAKWGKYGIHIWRRIFGGILLF